MSLFDQENTILHMRNLELSQSLEQMTNLAKNALADLIITDDGILNVDNLNRSQIAYAIHLLRFCMISKP